MPNINKITIISDDPRYQVNSKLIEQLKKVVDNEIYVMSAKVRLEKILGCKPALVIILILDSGSVITSYDGLDWYYEWDISSYHNKLTELMGDASDIPINANMLRELSKEVENFTYDVKKAEEIINNLKKYVNCYTYHFNPTEKATYTNTY